MVGAVIFGVFIVETFAVGFLLSQAKELREQNELLRDFTSHYQSLCTSDWPSVDEPSEMQPESAADDGR